MSEPPGGPVSGRGIVFNSWLAEDLSAAPGDAIELTCYVRSGTGLLEEETAEFTLERVVETSGLGADRTLVPEFEGVTDARTVGSWDPPRDFDFHSERIRPKDEEYWDRHGPAPKAFVGIEAARELWGTVYGALTSLRFDGVGEEKLRDSLVREIPLSSVGLVWRPIRQEQLAQATSTTDFGQLFIGFSFFLIVSAALLVVLVMRLSVEQRTRQIGVMFATGFTLGRIRGLLLAEGIIVLAGGALLGVAASAGYARLMLAGLKTLWQEAIGTKVLELSVSPRTLGIGFAGGLVVGAVAVWRGIGRVDRMRVAEAVSGRRHAEAAKGGSRRAPAIAAAVLFALAVGGIVLGALSETFGSTLGFFLAGLLFLVASLLALRAWLVRTATERGAETGRLSLAGLGIANASRNPLRSMLTAGLLASAAFVAVSVGSMRSGGAAGPNTKGSGLGGYDLVAEFDAPVPYDLDRPEARRRLALGAGPELWEGVRFVGLRTSRGEDVSCRNLYRTVNPRVTGVPDRFIEEGRFSFVSSLDGGENPWELLKAAPAEGPIPVAADGETARWILHRKLGDTVSVADENGRSRELRIVALVRKSIFQAELLMSERSFRELFPGRAGFGEFLIDAPPQKAERVAEALRKGLADFGATVETTRERLASFTRIADSYISAFASLGTLGLFLGSAGLVVVLLRGIVERRGEIALLGALGFGRWRVAFLVSAENAFLLAAGMAAGTVSALAAVAPQFARGYGGAGPVVLTCGYFAAIVVGVAALLVAVSAVALRGISPASLRAE
jgi:hypothetical protein